MKKKLLYTVLAGVVSAATLYGASARLDFVGKGDASGMISFMEDNINKLLYVSDSDGEGVSHVKVVKKDGTESIIALSDYPQLNYVAADGSVAYSIDTANDGHGRVNLLDCLNNPDDKTGLGIIDPTKPLDWHGAQPDWIPHFLLENEPGYDVDVVIEGQYSKTRYTDDESFVFISTQEDSQLWTDSYGFYMPNEPVMMTAVTTERHTYDGQSFVGMYSGYPLKVADNRILKNPEKCISLDIRGNGSYKLVTTDENSYDIHRLYSWNEKSGSLYDDNEAHAAWDLSVHYGAYVILAADEFAVVDVENLTTGADADARYYFVGKKSFDYICVAADPYGYRYVIEIMTGGEKRWFLVENYCMSVSEASLDFRSGNSIEGPCVAFVSKAGSVEYKYVKAEGEEPQLIVKGKEAGTYTGASGNLILNGFGDAELSGTAYDYTIEGAVVSLVRGGETTQFVIDAASMTYEAVNADMPWEGYDVYKNESATGAYGNVQSQRNHMYVYFDQNLVGAEKSGYASVKIDVLSSSGTYRNIVADCQKYVYDKEAKTVTITNVLVGMASGGSQRENLVLKISDDMKSVWFDDSQSARIYATSSNQDWVSTGTENTLVYPETAEVVSVKYTGKVALYLNDNDGPYENVADGILTLNEDASGNIIAGTATFVAKWVSPFITVVTEYEKTDTQIILKNAVTGNWRIGETTSDIVFDIDSDGVLHGSGRYYSTDGSKSDYSVDLSGATLSPVSE